MEKMVCNDDDFEDDAGVKCKHSPDGSCENCILYEGDVCPYEENGSV